MSLKRHFPEFAFAGAQVDPNEIARYEIYQVESPSVDTAYIGTVTSSTANAALVFKSVYPDYPRNVAYSVTGGASGQGGTFTLAGQDQFGGTVVESVTIATANGGGTTQGTAIFAKFGAGTYSPNGAAGSSGTAAIGFGTASGATGNWFGLPTKIQGTGDVKTIVWINNGTPTALNVGTAIGTLVSTGSGTTSPFAFQGTAGVSKTDTFIVTFKPTWDNTSRTSMTGL